jgi:hypothetical protein
VLSGHWLIANWMSFLETSGYLICLRMFPSGTLPSCRFLPPRVLAWWRYDAHWLRQAYRCFHTLEAIATTTGHLDDSWHSPSSSGLRPTSRFLADTDTGWQSPAPPQVSPLSAPSSSDVSNTVSNRAAHRPQVFATSRRPRRPQRLAGLFHPAGTPRVLASRV